MWRQIVVLTFMLRMSSIRNHVPADVQHSRPSAGSQEQLESPPPPSPGIEGAAAVVARDWRSIRRRWIPMGLEERRGFEVASA